jgi:rhodanese-related sulfurtransferase
MSHHLGFLALVDAARPGVNTLSADGYVARRRSLPEHVLLDVREREEFDAGHVRGAQWLGKGILERDIEAFWPERDTPLYLYCGGGYRSILAADALQKMGYRNVVSIDGGWKALQGLLPVNPA